MQMILQCMSEDTAFQASLVHVFFILFQQIFKCLLTDHHICSQLRDPVIVSSLFFDIKVRCLGCRMAECMKLLHLCLSGQCPCLIRIASTLHGSFHQAFGNYLNSFFTSLKFRVNQCLNILFNIRQFLDFCHRLFSGFDQIHTSAIHIFYCRNLCIFRFRQFTAKHIYKSGGSFFFFKEEDDSPDSFRFWNYFQCDSGNDSRNSFFSENHIQRIHCLTRQDFFFLASGNVSYIT